MDKNRTAVTFAAINKYIEDNIIAPTEKSVTGKDFIVWGEGNKYPAYISSLYNDVTLLRSIVNGSADYTCGNNIVVNVPRFTKYINPNGDTIDDLVKSISIDYYLYGGFALDVERDLAGNVAGIYYIDLKFLRSDEKNNVFYYSKDWSKSYGRVDYTSYPRFSTKKDNKSSIYFFKTNKKNVYPTPSFAGTGVWACETIKEIGKYHLNAPKNAFTAGHIINFNSGIPEDVIKEEIERNFDEKFCGSENAQRLMLSFNNDKEHAVTVEKIDTADFGEKYNALVDHCRQELFTAFRAVPCLFAVMTDNKGFSEEPFNESFKIFNRTVIQPAQRAIVNAFDFITGVEGSITIEPFSIDFSDDADEENVIDNSVNDEETKELTIE